MQDKQLAELETIQAQVVVLLADGDAHEAATTAAEICHAQLQARTVNVNVHGRCMTGSTVLLDDVKTW